MKKSETIAIMIDLVQKNLISSIEVIRFESTNALEPHVRDLIEQHKSQPEPKPERQPLPKAIVVSRSDAPWNF